jgi:hypothetical protein
MLARAWLRIAKLLPTTEVHMASPLLYALLVVTFGSEGAGPTPKPRPADLVHMEQRSRLPNLVRELLQERMADHGDEMQLLLEAVLMLNPDLAQQVARQIAGQPILSRPISGEPDTVNAEIPKAFFRLQEQLRTRARAVGAAASSGDSRRLAKSTGSLIQTCVACHSVYLGGDEEAPGPPPR